MNIVGFINEKKKTALLNWLYILGIIGLWMYTIGKESEKHDRLRTEYDGHIAWSTKKAEEIDAQMMADRLAVGRIAAILEENQKTLTRIQNLLEVRFQTMEQNDARRNYEEKRGAQLKKSNEN